jgi:hypothetical protein
VSVPDQAFLALGTRYGQEWMVLGRITVEQCRSILDILAP